MGLSILGLLLIYAATQDTADAWVFYIVTAFVDALSVWADIKGQSDATPAGRATGWISIALDSGSFFYDATH